MTADELKAFEQRVAEAYDAGKIHAPVHLSGGNESQLIEIFKDISRDDLVLATWRSHYAALLHGVDPEELFSQILRGRSMYINSLKPWFYASSIAGGILPIAVGLGMAIKQKATLCRDCDHEQEDHHMERDYEKECEACDCNNYELRKPQKVWCFCGDMASEMGIFYESLKYAENFDLPMSFIIEDNGKSVLTSTATAWGKKGHWTGGRIISYSYELTWPHHGTGKGQRAF